LAVIDSPAQEARLDFELRENIRAVETLTPFLELERAIRKNSIDTVYRRLPESRSR
jgi:hypothetical protein